MLNTTSTSTTISTLKSFRGTTQYYSCAECDNVYWTDGVQYYISQLNAYNILDYINFYCAYISKGNLNFLRSKSPELDYTQLQMLKGIQFWEITETKNNKWMLSCQADTDFPKLFKHLFDYNLIPQKFMCQRFSTQKWVFMLYSEY